MNSTLTQILEHEFVSNDKNLTTLYKLVKVIKEQQRQIRKCRYDPTWDLFKDTFGWFQIKENLNPETRDFYKEVWEKVYKGEL